MTKSDQQTYLQALINRILDDSAQPFIIKRALCPSGREVDPITMEILNEWKDLGVLRILNAPEKIGPDQPLLEMLRFVGRSSPIPGLLDSGNGDQRGI